MPSFIAHHASNTELRNKETQYSGDTPVPIASLVPDILLEIFILALPADETHTHSKTESPLNVSQVSRAWRQLAISSSLLWSRISFVLDRHSSPFDSSDERTRYIHRILCTWNLWLERSKTCPLKITVRQLSSLTEDEEHEAIGLLLEKTVESLHRWSDVEIQLFTYRFLALVPGYPSSLQRLLLTNRCFIWPLSIVSTKTLSRLDNIPGGKMIGGTIIPYTSTVHNAKPSLSMLDIPEDGAVFTSNLHYLSIHGLSTYALQKSLAHHVLPSLLALEIVVGMRRGDDTRPIGIYSLVRSSGASLKSLDLTRVLIKFDELHGVLLSSPLLESWRMRRCVRCGAPSIINALTIQSQSQDVNILCPRLSTMLFERWFIDTTELADGLVDMVESRWKLLRSRDPSASLYAAFLSSVLVGVENSSSSSEALARCISEGLEFEISHRNYM